MLSLSRSSIYLLIDSDQLRPIRIGRSVRFTVEQLEQFVADRTLTSFYEFEIHFVNEATGPHLAAPSPTRATSVPYGHERTEDLAC